MSYVTKEEILKAKQMDILTYMQMCEPYELVKLSDNVYTTKTHDSLKISNGMWFWWSRGIGGKSVIDYLVYVKGMEFTKAVQIITKQEYQPIKQTTQTAANKPLFSLPKPYINNQKVINYLKCRGIDEKLIFELIKQKKLYEDKHHNCGNVNKSREKKLEQNIKPPQ